MAGAPAHDEERGPGDGRLDAVRGERRGRKRQGRPVRGVRRVQARLDDLDDELFRFGRIVQANPELHWTLSDTSIPGDRKRALLEELLSGRVTPATLRLIAQLAVHPRGRSLEKGLEEFGRLVAQQRQRLVAVVRTAVPLSDAQRERLTAWLSATYGRDIHLNSEVDPKVLGGFSVRVGDEIIDTTIVGRIEEVRRRLAG